jgi:hypothetical protein
MTGTQNIRQYIDKFVKHDFVLESKKWVLGIVSNFASGSRSLLARGVLRASDFPSRFIRLMYYFRIWMMMSRNAFLVVLSQKKVLMLFLTGKVIRFIFFTTFIYFLVKGTKTLAGFNVHQVIFFYLTFNLIEVISQFLYREVYRFRHLLVSGDLDLILTKPMEGQM